MWLIIIAAIDQRTETRYQLCHSYVKVLSKWVGCQAGIIHIFRRIQQTFCRGISRKINTCQLTKSKYMLILAKVVFTNQCSDLHQCHVTGILHSLFDGLCAMSFPIDTVNIVISHMQHTAAIEGLVSFQCSSLQCCCYRKRFNSWSRLIRIADTEIFPQRIQCFQFIIIWHCL